MNNWQEFDKEFGDVYCSKAGAVVNKNLGVTSRCTIQVKHFIQSILDQKAEEINKLKRPGDCDGVSCYCGGEPEEDCEVFEYNQALDDALTILKGEE